MPITSLAVSGYRGFASRQKLPLAVPNGKPGSGLTLVVGANNTGKSALLECIQMLQSPGGEIPIREAQRNPTAGGRIEIEFESETGRGVYSSRPGTGDLGWTDSTLGLRSGAVYHHHSRRSFNPTFTISGLERQGYSQTLPYASLRQVNRDYFTRRLPVIESKRDAFDRVMTRLLVQPPAWFIERTEGGSSYLKVWSASAPHNSDGLGDGLVSLLMIADAVYDIQSGDIVAIDEPELSLHPDLQRRLSDLLIDVSAHNQVVLATHSPYFVGIDALANGARISRVSLDNRASRIDSLSPSLASEIAALVNDVNNPHTVGLQAREVFFLSDRVILVEGQEDVVAYTDLARQLGVQLPASFFGWGVGGAAKMPLFARVLAQLGFSQVYGILDSDQAQRTKALQKEFPQYAFSRLPTVNVRDRPAVRSKESVDGILAHDLTLKREHEAYARTLMQAIRKYFDPSAA